MNQSFIQSISRLGTGQDSANAPPRVANNSNTAYNTYNYNASDCAITITKANMGTSPFEVKTSAMQMTTANAKRIVPGGLRKNAPHCPMCRSRCILFTGNNLYCYRCQKDYHEPNPVIRSALNGSNGEATNGDDMEDRNRARKEAKNRMLHGKVADGKHGKRQDGAVRTRRDDARRVIKKEENEVVVPPVVQAPAVQPPIALLKHQNNPVQRRVYFKHNVKPTSTFWWYFMAAVFVMAIVFLPFESTIVNYHWRALVNVFYSTPNLRGTNFVDFFRRDVGDVGLYVQLTRLRFRPDLYPAYKALLFHLARWVAQCYCLIWSLGLFFGFIYVLIGPETASPYEQVLRPFMLPWDYHDNRVVRYSRDLAGFNAYTDVAIDLTLYRLLQRKHPLVTPREHTIQLLMSTAAHSIDPESFGDHHQMYMNTCELYFQDMMRHEARRLELGARRTIPIE